MNRHLAALINSWERGGLPLHMNLAFLNRSSPQLNQDILSRLKHQNCRLTEVRKKKDYLVAELKNRFRDINYFFFSISKFIYFY